MLDSQNPLIPAAYDNMWFALSLLIVAFVIAALVSIARTAKRLTSMQALVWTLIVLLVPVVGCAAWFAIGRSAVAGRQPEGIR